MSYDCVFMKDGAECVMDCDAPAGGTYCAGGTKRAWLNITYNYSPVFRQFGISMTKRLGADDGVVALEGMSAGEMLPVLTEAIGKMKQDVDADYWKPTEGNARKALAGLLFIAANVPADAVLEVY